MDFDQQQQMLAERRRRYQAQALQEGPDGRMVGRTYVAPHALEYIAAGLRGYGGMKGEQQTEKAMGDLSTKRQQAMAELLAGFSKDMAGTPYNPGTQGLEEFGRASIPDQAAVPGSMEKGFERLATSQFPEFQKMGMQGQVSTAQAQQQRAQQLADAERARELKTQEAERERQRIAAIMSDPNLTPQQKIAMGIPKEAADPNFGKSKLAFVEGMPVDQYTGQPVGAVIPQRPRVPNLASDLLIPDPANPGKLIPNTQLVGVKTGLAKAGASRNSQTVINAGPKEFEKELGQLDARQLGKYRDNAETAQSLLGTIGSLREAEKSGAYSGGGADIRLGVSSMIEGWTGIAPKGLVGSQLYNAEANKLILDRVKALGANPSNADREFIQKTVPQLATSAEARKQMVEWMERTAMKSIDLYQQADSYARKNSGLGGFNVITPTTPKPAGLPDASAIDAEIARRKAASK